MKKTTNPWITDHFFIIQEPNYLSEKLSVVDESAKQEDVKTKIKNFFITEIEKESNRWPLSEEVKTACKCLIDTVNRGVDDD